MSGALLAIALLAAAAVAAGCGDEEASADRPRLTIAAAASLSTAFEDYGARFDAATARFSFAGSDELAAQIRQGVRPDLYAAADTALPEQLFDEGLVERPTVFAANRLVIAVPSGPGAIVSLDDLGAPGLDLAIGSAEVPVGAYTLELLDRLPAGDRDAILANVRSNEPDVTGVTGKLTQGAADAGFLYATDVAAAGGRLKPVELPARLQPRVAYGIAVVEGTSAPAAREFIAGLLAGDGREAMRRAGFEPAPPR